MRLHSYRTTNIILNNIIFSFARAHNLCKAQFFQISQWKLHIAFMNVNPSSYWTGALDQRQMNENCCTLSLVRSWDFFSFFFIFMKSCCVLRSNGCEFFVLFASCILYRMELMRSAVNNGSFRIHRTEYRAVIRNETLCVCTTECSVKNCAQPTLLLSK